MASMSSATHLPCKILQKSYQHPKLAPKAAFSTLDRVNLSALSTKLNRNLTVRAVPSDDEWGTEKEPSYSAVATEEPPRWICWRSSWLTRFTVRTGVWVPVVKLERRLLSWLPSSSRRIRLRLRLRPCLCSTGNGFSRKIIWFDLVHFWLFVCSSVVLKVWWWLDDHELRLFLVCLVLLLLCRSVLDYRRSNLEIVLFTIGVAQ